MKNIVIKIDLLKSYRYVLLAAFVMVLLYGILFIGGNASAAALNGQFGKVFVRFDSLKALDTGVTGRACFQPSVTTAINSVQIVFPQDSGTDYSLNTTAANWTITTSPLDTTPSETAATGIGTTATSIVNTAPKSLSINFTSPLTPSLGTLYCFNWSGTSTLTMPSAGATENVGGVVNTYSAVNNGGTWINSSSYSEPQTVATVGDTVAVNAVVPPSFSFALNGSTDTFATNLSASSVNTSNGALKGIVTTNAASGWVVWAKDVQGTGNTCTKGGLWSPTKLYCIQSAATANSAPALVTTGAENYAFSVNNNTTGTAGTCTLVNVASYNYDGITHAGYGGVLSNTAYNPIASCNGTSTASNVYFQELVTTTGATPAANDYADTIQLTGAGQF
jgi:hypothetical protein